MYKLPNGTTVYPQDIECVHDPVNGKGGIFIGNLEAAQNLQTLKKNGIRAVLTAAKGVFLDHPKSQIPFQLYIPGQDHEKFDMSKYFGQSISFIRDALQKTNILVHCLAGVSRSVSLVMAYFIKFQNMAYEDVYSKIKSRRKIIHPNDGFIAQLRKFEAQCRQRGPVIQRTEFYDMRSSYSPSKRTNMRGYEGYEVSPQKKYESPEKRYSRNIRYSQIQASSRYQLPQSEKIEKNPEMYRSKAEQFATQRCQIRNYSPDRFQKQNRLNSSVALKRLSSVNIDMESRNDISQRNQFFSNYPRYEARSRIRSDYKPLDSIQNKSYEVDSEIDRKIAEIRKKYQQYTKKNDSVAERNDRVRIERKFSNISTIQESTQNDNFEDVRQFKMKKLGSKYESVSINDVYGGVGVEVRNNNYFNETPSSNVSTKLMQTRLRRLQSYQV